MGNLCAAAGGTGGAKISSALPQTALSIRDVSSMIHACSFRFWSGSAYNNAAG